MPSPVWRPAPSRQGAKASHDAQVRCTLDDNEFPPEAYEPHSLLWRGQEWRTYLPEERAVLHGLPPSVTDPVKDLVKGHSSQLAKRNSILGNGLHLPSFLLSLIVLLQLAQSQPHLLRQAPCSYAPDEAWLRLRAAGTCLQPGMPESMPCCMTWRQIALEVVASFDFVDAGKDVTRMVQTLEDVPSSSI